ncbi:titin-like isoform X2 [Halichondria panicea]|uniref:titin-like isoform X2 n=1 Tax=Halichondria panicea TaxID=6063 RepID=UPI00312BAF7A
MDGRDVYMRPKEDEIKLLKCEADFYRSCNAVRQNGYELQQLKNYLVNELLELQKNRGRKTREYAVYAQNTIEELQASKQQLNEELEQVKTMYTSSKEVLNEKLERMKTDLKASTKKLNKELEQVKTDYTVSKKQLNEELERIKTDLKKFSRTSGAEYASTNVASVTCTTIGVETISDTRQENSPDTNILQVARIPVSNDVIVPVDVPKEKELKKKQIPNDENTEKRKPLPKSASVVETDQPEDPLTGSKRARMMSGSKIVPPNSQISKRDIILPFDKGEKPSIKKQKSASVELGSDSEADKQQEMGRIKRAKTGGKSVPIDNGGNSQASKKKSKDISMVKRKPGRPRKISKANKVPVTVRGDSEQPKSTEPKTSLQDTDTQIAATPSEKIENKKSGRPRKQTSEEIDEITPTIVPDKVPVTVRGDSEQPKSTEPNTSTQVAATPSENIEHLKAVSPKEKEIAEIIPVSVAVTGDSEQLKFTELKTSLQDTQVAATPSENKKRENNKSGIPRKQKPEENAKITFVPDKVPVTVRGDSEQPKSTEPNTSTQVAATPSENIELLKPVSPKERKLEEIAEIIPVPVAVRGDSEQLKFTEPKTSLQDTQVAATPSGKIENKKRGRPRKQKLEQNAEITDKVPVTVRGNSEQPKSTELKTSLQYTDTQVATTPSEKKKPGRSKKRKTETKKVPVTVRGGSEQPKSTEPNTSTQVAATPSENIELLKLVSPKEKEIAEIIPVPVTVKGDSEQPKFTEPKTSTQVAVTPSENIKLQKPVRPKKRKSKETSESDSEYDYDTLPSSVVKVRPIVNIPVVFISSRTRSRLSFSDHSIIEEDRPPPKKKPRKQKKRKITLSKRKKPTVKVVPKVPLELDEQTSSDLDTKPSEVTPLLKATNENTMAEVRAADSTQSVRKDDVTIKPRCDQSHSPEIPLQNVTTASIVNDDTSIEPVAMDTSPHAEEPTEQNSSHEATSTLRDKHSQEPAKQEEMNIDHSQNLSNDDLLTKDNYNEITPLPTEITIFDGLALVPVHVNDVPPTALTDTPPPHPVNDKDNIVNDVPPTALTDTSPPHPVNDKDNIVNDVPPTALTDTSPPHPVNDKDNIVNDVPPTALTDTSPPHPVNDKDNIVNDVPPTALTDTSPPHPPVNDKDNIEPIVNDVPPTALTDTSPPHPVNDKIELNKPIASKESEAPRTYTNRLSISKSDFTRKSKTHDKFRFPKRKTKKPASSIDLRKDVTMSQAVKKLPKALPNNTTSFGYSLVANSSMLPPLKRRKTISSVNNSTVSAFQLSIVDDQEQPNRKPPIRVHTSGLKTLKLRDTSSLEKSNTS